MFRDTVGALTREPGGIGTAHKMLVEPQGTSNLSCRVVSKVRCNAQKTALKTVEGSMTGC